MEWLTENWPRPCDAPARRAKEGGGGAYNLPANRLPLKFKEEALARKK